MKELIIQCFVGGKWCDLHTFSDTLEGVKLEAIEDKGFNPNLQFRIIERTTTIVDEVIFQE